MTSYLCKLPARDPNISDNGHLKHENNFWTQNFWPSRRFSHATAQMMLFFLAIASSLVILVQIKAEQ